MESMAEKLNHAGFEFAKALVHKGKVVRVERDDWSEHQPSTEKENEFIRLHGFAEYAKWHLGIDDQKTEDTKARSSSLMATSRRSTAVESFPQKVGQGNISTLILKTLPLHCTA
jgi:hypothetical protein